MKAFLGALLALASSLALPALAQEAQKVPIKAKQYRVAATSEAVKIDGVLDDAAWKTAQPMEFDAETSPGDNIKPPARTVGYMTYDSKNLYVAIHAYDPDPKAIRAHITDRDSAFSDDFTGVVLDTFNDNRRAFEFFVNPLGVQMDLIQDDTNRNEDSSWDAIWNTAGRITDDGYIVEMAIPFTSIRFPKSNEEQTWGVDMVRIYPRSSRRRLGLQGQDRNRNCYLCQSSRVTGFTGITPGRDVELDPTITAQHTSTREDFPGGGLSSGGADVDAGLTARWGITPNLTLNAALNPDFSQIEADAVQLDINTQFALFFNEKRPFFLEGSDFFQSPLQAVYTRTVADPRFGLKTTGRIGGSTIGAYIVEDEVTNLIIPGPQGSEVTSLEQKNRAGVFRYRFNVGETSSIGAMLTTRDGDGYNNRVLGIDGNFRITTKDTITGQLLGSRGQYPAFVAAEFDQPGKTSDIGGRLEYRHNSKHWFWSARYEDLGDEFRADSGFIPQVGYRHANGGAEYSGYGEQGKNWYTRWWLGGDYDWTHEQNGRLLEEETEAWVAVQGPMQTFAQLDGGTRKQQYNGVSFDEKFLNWNGEIRPTGDFYIFLNGKFADQIDFANTQLGDRFNIGGGIRWNIGKHASVDIDHSYDDLDVEGGKLFAARVTQLRTVYQFNIRMFARAILQYTDITRNPALYRFDEVPARSKRVFPQLLFSYKLNPQTVFFAGYSGTRLGGEFDGVDVGLTEADRTFFVKLGYAWLF
ncbi:MAG TPA: DUF5916 domain-containing protein [Thermoanaerobaculia bacterium]|nr:DUF5916 domain-containing protein [Thermoanaerobaculia bacterium]